RSLIRRSPCACPTIETDPCPPPGHVHRDIHIVQNGFIRHVNQQFPANPVDSSSGAHNRTYRRFQFPDRFLNPPVHAHSLVGFPCFAVSQHQFATRTPYI